MVSKFDGESFGSEPSRSSESDFVAQLGRISGKALQPNLVRNGFDLTFRNGATDPDLLYLDVNNLRVGINTDGPNYDLDVDGVTKTIRLITDTARIDNILISNNQFSTVVGPINIVPQGPDPIITVERLTTSNLEFNNNTISSFNNSNIVLDASGTGTVNLQANTNISKDLSVSGNINIDGDLSKQGNIIIGDQPLDVVVINTDFTQSIIPGDDISYDLGKVDKKWDNLYTPDLSNVTLISPSTAVVSNQLSINGITNEIRSVQSNDDVELVPDTGIIYIEQTKWQDNTITNLLDSPLIIDSTGIGYVRFMGSNGFVVPSGDNSGRRLMPEVGETRWNTEQGWLECYDGNVWLISIGPGELITIDNMQEISNVWSLILG